MIKSRCLRQMFGVQKNRVHAYEMLPCKALRAMKTGTECPQVQISNILGRAEKKGAFTSYPTDSFLLFETACTV